MKNQNNTATSLSAYLTSLFGRYKFYICSLAVLAILAAIANILVNYKIKEIIDIIASNKDAQIGWLLMLFLFYRLMRHAMTFLMRILDGIYKPKILGEVVGDMYTKTIGHSLHWFDSHLSGEIASKIIDFQNIVITIITMCFRALINGAMVVIGILFMWQVSHESAMVMIGFVIIYTPILCPLLIKQLQLQKQYVSARQETVGIINDSIANIFGIKIIGNVWTEFKLKLTPSISRWSGWDRKTRRFDAYVVDTADTTLAMVMMAVQIYVLAMLYKNGQVTAGDFAFIAMMTISIQAELDQLLESLLFNIIPGIATMKSSFAFVSAGYDTADKEDAKTLNNVKGKIEFVNVTFAYNVGSKDVLHEFNLEIPSGQRLGIVGTSGAGKTTLIKCLLRYFDVQAGQIMVDGNNIADVTQESLRANISVIPQDITMFHRTILENLQLAKHDASFDEIVDACKKAKIHDDIMAMGKGYDSIVGERGVKVSGGQRQRIAIARAILKNAPILILDEATSALDTPTEQLIQASLNEVLETSKATVIAIAHRLSTLKHMDRIIVLDKGKIMEEGSHDVLIKRKNGLYKKLWEMQAI